MYFRSGLTLSVLSSHLTVTSIWQHPFTELSEFMPCRQVQQARLIFRAECGSQWTCVSFQCIAISRGTNQSITFSRLTLKPAVAPFVGVPIGGLTWLILVIPDLSHALYKGHKRKCYWRASVVHRKYVAHNHDVFSSAFRKKFALLKLFEPTVVDFNYSYIWYHVWSLCKMNHNFSVISELEF